MTMNRREFLAALGSGAAALALRGQLAPGPAYAAPAGAGAAADLTTLVQTLRAGPAGDLGYRPIITGPGERHVVRDELVKADAGRTRTRRTLLHFVHLTDQHIIDVQSPSRVEFLDRYSDEQCGHYTFFQSAFRPQEAANARIADAMLRRLRRIRVSPVTGAPIAAAVCTGDNTDNQQLNELDVFLKVMDGGRVTPNSGNPTVYEGVQKSGDRAYWHPDPGITAEPDLYKTLFGFPDAPGWLEQALAPFDALGAGVPWYSAYGNHDGLAQGNAPVNPAFETIGTQGVKVVGSPDTVSCSSFDDPSRLGELFTQPGAPTIPVTADPARRYVSRREWMEGHLKSSGRPRGHGFTQANLDENRAYYAADVGPIRWLVLDTVNPGGYASGNIGQRQLDWLDAELTKADKQRKLTMLFSHHGLRSLDNPLQNPDPLAGADGNDNPRYNADAVLEVIAKHDCVIAWVNGHTHENIIETQAGKFWDIGTAAHIDFPAQSRLIEVVDNRDGTLSIFTTMVDHEDDPIASFARELMANDPQKGFGYGEGKVEDRNAELLLPHPFAAGGGGGGDRDRDRDVGGGEDGPNIGGSGSRVPALPATGGSLHAVGALAVAAGAGLLRLRERQAEDGR